MKFSNNGLKRITRITRIDFPITLITIISEIREISFNPLFHKIQL